MTKAAAASRESRARGCGGDAPTRAGSEMSVCRPARPGEAREVTIYIYIYIHTYIHTHIYVYIYIYIYTYLVRHGNRQCVTGTVRTFFNGFRRRHHPTFFNGFRRWFFFMVSVVAGNVFVMVSVVGFLWFSSWQGTFSF